MIFYFSGTGNSLYVAKDIEKNQNEKVISISNEINKNKQQYEYELKEQESIIFIYPIYAWAPPSMVIEFISKLKLINYEDNYICSIATCGEDIGNTMNYFDTVLKNVGLSLNSGFSVVAPNNYMIIGDVDNKEVENKKLLELDKELVIINGIISKKEVGLFKAEKGKIPKITTGIINPFFNKYARNTSKFYANENCTGCKICEKVCNSKCIKVNEKPIWKDGCSQCLACINYCPTKAIQYGKNTLNKGRYTNPNIKVEGMYQD